MARVELITERVPHLSDEQAALFDYVVESRGKMIRPFEVLIHSPDIARSVAELGAKIRFESSLDDHDRELTILAVGIAHGCAFVWDSHVELARAAGVRPEVLEGLRSGSEVDHTEREALLIGAAQELCRSGTVSEEHYEALVAADGPSGAVEFSATVGYYTLLGFVMGAAAAC